MRVPRNALAIVLSRLLGAAGAFVTATVVAGRLGSAGFGSFAAVLAAAALAHVVLTLGLDTLVVRAVADDPAAAAPTVLGALRVRSAGALVAIGVVLVGFVLGLAPLAVLVGSLGLVPVGVYAVASAVLRGAQEMTALATTAALTAVLTVTGAAVLVDDSVAVAVAIVVVAALPSTAWLAWRAATQIGLGPRELGRHRSGRLGVDAVVLAGATAASAVIATGSVITFDVLGGDAGGLAAGLRLLEAIRLLPAAVFGALFPAMLAGVQHGRAYRHGFVAVVGYVVVATAIVVAAAPWLTSTFFDGATEALTATRVLALAALATPFRLRWSFELIAAGREREVLRASAVAAGLAAVGYVAGSVAGSVTAVAVVQVAAGVLHALLLHRVVRRVSAGDGGEGAPSGDGSVRPR